MEIKVMDYLAETFISLYVLAGLVAAILIRRFFPESADGLLLIAFGVLAGRAVYYGIRFWWEELR